MVDVHTVGAGGGSIGWRDAGGALRVGPRSAGAEPGPACYGRGGTEPTVTDANLLLGYLSPGLGAGGRRRAGRGGRRGARVAALGEQLGLDEIETAEGIVRVANQEMVRALRVVTVERGVDPRGYALLPFGGAGPDARRRARRGARDLPDRLPARQRRALGARADRRRAPAGHGADRAARGRRDHRRARRLGGRAARSGRCSPGMEGAELEVVYELRYRGQAFELPIPGPPEPDPAQLAEDFAARARGALRLPRPRGRAGAGQRSGSRRSSPGPSRGPAPPRAGLDRGRARRPGSTANGWRRGCCRASPRPGSRPRVPASSSCRRRRWSCRRAGARRSTRSGTRSTGGTCR